MARNVTVLIAGAGPVGLTLANELTRYGISVRIVDKAAEVLPRVRPDAVVDRRPVPAVLVGGCRECLEGIHRQRQACARVRYRLGEDAMSLPHFRDYASRVRFE